MHNYSGWREVSFCLPLQILDLFSNCRKLIYACEQIEIKIYKRTLLINDASSLTWTPCSCCQFFAHAHRTWHRCTVPMCNSTEHRMPPCHWAVRQRLGVPLDFRYEPSQYRHDNDRLSKRTDTFAVKQFVGTAKKRVIRLKLVQYRYTLC